MPFSTHFLARRELFDHLVAAWDAGTVLLPEYSSPPLVEFAGIELSEENKAGPSDSWSRLSMRHEAGEQRGFGNGFALHEQLGTVEWQIFAPLQQEEGLRLVHSLVNIAFVALRDTCTPNGVRIFRAHIEDIGPTDDWYQINVVGDFEYDIEQTG